MNRAAPLIAVALAVAMSVPGPGPRAAVIEEIAASVNGQIITRSRLMERERQIMAQISSRYVGDELDREMERMRANLLSDMIREEILLQRAEILGLELDKVYQQALQQLKEQQGIKTQEELDQVLKQEGIGKDELRDTLLRFNVPDIMVNLEVREKITVNEQEIGEFFEKNRETFRVEESFTIQEIVLTQEDRTAEELGKLGATVIEEARAGAPFNELVVKYSQAPSRFNDGKIGPLRPGELAPEIEAAARALAKGAVSEPIPTRAGLHIIRLEEHVEAKEPGLDDARKEITSRLKQEKFSVALKEYLEMLIRTNRVVVNSNYKQYDQRS